ncbi:MAG: 3-oxoacyl-ACP reductase FabG, partial [Solirubrobacteraceae bacterium]|nr:3-oxoacyl-ACP reductase FabG [Solirubrobacteraceae bacterium]
GFRGAAARSHASARNYFFRRPQERARMFSPLTGRRVLVTGGTRGIGKGIAATFAQAGCAVVITGRDPAVGAAASAELGEIAAAAGGSVTFIAGDLADSADCEAIVETAVDTLGGLDVLCANAGIFPQAALVDLTAADIDHIFNVNVRSMMLVITAAIPALTESGRGRVIITSSITGPFTGYPGWAHYGATKAAQLGYMRTAAIELAPRGITVNAVLPGNILTEGLADMGEDYLAGMAASIPHAKLGTPADIGAVALFFATDEASYVTGQSVAVDGGQILPESPQALDELTEAAS